MAGWDDVSTVASGGWDAVSSPVEKPRPDAMRGDDMGAFASGVQGFNSAVPFGNRFTAGAAALVNYPIAKMSGSDLTLSELYDTARANQAATESAHPTANNVGAAAGVVNSLPLLFSQKAAAATPLIGDAANVVQKGNAALANSLSTGNLLARATKGAGYGAATGALYGAGNSADGQMLEGAGQGAIAGGVAGGVLPVAGAVASDIYNTGKNALTGAFSKTPEAIQDIAAGFKGDAGDLYNQMRQVGAVLNPSTSNGLLSTISGEIAKNKFIPALNPKTTAIIDDLTEAVQKSGGQIGLDELDQYRRMLGRIGGSEDGVSAGEAKRAIDKIVDGLSGNSLVNGGADAVNLLKQGRAQYAQAFKYEAISDILARADGDANKIKSGLKRFLINEDNLRGWTAAEKAALKDAATLSGTEGLLKLGGKFGLDIGGSTNIGNGVGAVVGYGVGGGAAPIAGTAARQTQKWAARGKAENLLNVLEGKSVNPLTLNTPPALSLSATQAATGIQNARQPQMPPSGFQPTAQPAATMEREIQSAPVKPQSALFQRVIQQESGGRQLDKKGNPITSSKGAIGIAQIMPKTAKDAAKAAGLPYDPFKLRNDAEYNAALGEAYLNQMLDTFGNETHALMAYNWGPGNVKMWLKSGANPDKIPAETRNYVQSILGT